MSIERIDGVPVIPSRGGEVLSVDAIAQLAGVNFQSVVKVLCAIELLHQYSGIDHDVLVSPANLPETPVINREDPRGERTRVLCETIAESGYARRYHCLRLESRFL